ncbi:helix-hairpin-helix domain-containing protein [Thermoplasma sp.]|uniref:helix-hairpin-helix domain-containing protein n=1 Tax=Thermoplasma sp. TaxID=1973142 RepID=UPI0026146E26|nr:helix-hairpin-helix domain-containing protein [Thermoplasma sp.]
MINRDIARIFNEIAYMIQASGDQRSSFEANAYLRAARSLESLQDDIETVYRSGGKEALMKIPGIGKGIADRIAEYIDSGTIKKYEDLRKNYPIDFETLTKIEGLGPKRILMLYRSIGVKDLNDLKKAIEDHRIRDLPGFGEKSEEILSQSLKIYESSAGRIPLPLGYARAVEIRDYLIQTGLAERVEIAGSTRRMKDTLGDIDILAVTEKPLQMMDAFTSMPKVKSVIAKGEKKSTVALDIGTTCDLRIISRESFGAALQYFTGSKDHNIRMRKIAIDHGMKLNEYGLFRDQENVAAGHDEDYIYRTLGLSYIDPELREDRGELEAAQMGKLPDIVKYDSLNADMCVKFDVSRAHDEMKKYGYGYILAYDGSEDAHGVFRIRAYTLNGNYSVQKTETTFRCIDASSFKDDVDSLVKYIKDEKVRFLTNLDAIGTPGEEKVSKIIGACTASRCSIMIDSKSMRPSSDFLFSLRKNDVRIAIASFAGNPDELSYIRFGIGITRRAWISADRIDNLLSVEKLV